MVPEGYPVHDNETAAFFATTEGRAGRPMLGSRDLNDPFTEHARSVLLSKIKADVEHRNLTTRYSRAMAAEKPGGTDAFQIHEYKMKGELVDYLKSTGLAWEPSIPERGGARWWAVHPDLGEAIMSTNAVALAKTRGQEIVTAYGSLHEALLGTEPEHVYDALIGASLPGALTDTRKVNDLLRFVIVSKLDLSKLSLEQIADFNREGEDLAALKKELLDAVADFGVAPDLEVWNDAMKERARNVVEEWGARESAFKAIRHLDTADAIDEAKDYLKAVAPGVVAGTATAAIISNLPGLIVGAVFASASIWHSWKAYQRPYRYLSRLAATPGVGPRHLLELSTA